MSKQLPNGSMVALVTPFADGKVDEKGLRRLVDFHAENGTDALVPCGTTGESPTLSHQEHNRVVEIVVDAAKGRIPVIAGAGSNSTQEAVALARHAEEAGADGVLVIVPYYNKPTQAGMVAHFEAVAKSISIPIVVYNIPSRTGVNMLPETLAKLARVKNIASVKESTGNLEQASQVRKLCDIQILSGDDGLTLPLMAVGAVGVISVAANIVPRKVHDLVHAALQGKNEKAQAMHYELMDLIKILFVETNPTPVKAAMAMMGMISEEIRLPMLPLSTQYRAALRDTLKRHGLLGAATTKSKS